MFRSLRQRNTLTRSNEVALHACRTHIDRGDPPLQPRRVCRLPASLATHPGVTTANCIGAATFLVIRLGSELDLIGPKVPFVKGLRSTRPAPSCVDCALTLPAAVSLSAGHAYASLADERSSFGDNGGGGDGAPQRLISAWSSLRSTISRRPQRVFNALGHLIVNEGYDEGTR